MRRTRRAGVLAIGSICLLLTAPVQAAADRAGLTPDRAGSRTGAAPVAAAPVVPLVAEVLVTGASGTTTDRLYRDSAGRTRYESGASVTISDPATRTTYKLDTATRTYQRQTRDTARSAPRPEHTVRRGLTSTMRGLGTSVVNGVAAEGRTYTVTTPADKLRPERVRDVTMWLAKSVQLPVSLRITGASGLEYSMSYTGIRIGVEPAAELFTVPAGYREAGKPGAPGRGVNEDCPIGTSPDPLVLNSYDMFWAYGYVTAVTEPNYGCAFHADGGYFQYPLWGQPTTPIGYWFDQWVAYDTGGGGLPYLPWVALGDIPVLAANTEDTTVKDALVVLTVWCC